MRQVVRQRAHQDQATAVQVGMGTSMMLLYFYFPLFSLVQL
jgi:hypothetical protein